LATNAAKYGALSNSGGRLDVSWSLADSRIRLSWIERGGPIVKPPTKRGFGTRLIERTARSELNGSVDLKFEASGLRCALTFPHITPQTAGPVSVQ